MKSILKVLAVALLITAFCYNLSTAAAFDPLQPACEGGGSNSPTCQQRDRQNASNANPAVEGIRTVTNIIAALSGVAAVIIIIYSGFQFITAGGSVAGQRSTDVNRAKQARSTLIGALVGLIIVALAWTIVNFVTDRIIQ